ncbi:hypothetical protein ABC977_10655 [Thioalkalicoccus limnaeus]|uniref:Terpene synthase n=1 Tax=Thioalkalicoccus limnaeus TaxID=120681 RepID=A0ABV4BHV5_9GAMM
MAKDDFIQLDGSRVVFRYGCLHDEPPFDAEIGCPLVAGLHRDHEAILEQHRAWARGFGILPNGDTYDRYCDTRFDLISAYQYYDLPVEAAVTAAHLMTWFFVFDDVMDISLSPEQDIRSYRKRLCERHLDLLAGGEASESDPPVIVAFDDFLQQVRQLCEPSLQPWYERMAHHLREYVMGTHWESLIGPTTAANSNTAFYLQVRHMTVGVAPCLDLMAVAKQIPPTPVLADPFVRRMERLAVNYSIWINDLAGLCRDVRQGLGNVVFTLQQDDSLSMADAVRTVARRCNGELDAFLDVERQLPLLLGDEFAGHEAAYLSYADVLKRWMRGLVDWSARSARYQRFDVDMALQNGTSIRQASKQYGPATG